MTATEFSLIEHAKEKARECCDELEDPEDDILPVLLWSGPYGLGIMPLIPMGNQEEKDRLAVNMTAALAVSRATEVVMTTCAWMVKADKPEGDAALLTVMPSEHPDRQENVVLMRQNADGVNSMTAAVVSRYPNKPPTLGEWETHDADVGLGGRFGDAVHLGLDMAKEMPDELVEIIDEGWKEGSQEDLIKRFIQVYEQAAEQAFKAKEKGGK